MLNVGLPENHFSVENRPIETILAELDAYTGFTKYDLVDELVARREEATPHLIALLEQILADPEGWLDGEHDITCYALVLLMHFEEQRAHRLIVALFSLPDDVSYGLFGDFIGQTLPAALLKTSGGALDGTRELILNRQASGYCRWSACSALGYAVVAGFARREEVVAFLSTLLQADQAASDSLFWDGVVDTLINLYPAAVMDEIRKAFENGLVNPGFVDINYIQGKVDKGFDSCMDELRESYQMHFPDDLHEYMRWWQEPAKKELKRAANAEASRLKKNIHRKKKNKQAKASRRLNR